MKTRTMGTEERMQRAIAAYAEGRRRRTMTGVFDRAADASLAAGGLFLANAALPLNFGIPAGRAGFSVGAGLLSAGFAWMTRNRRRTVTPPRATAPAMQRVVTPVRPHARALRRVA